MSPSTQRLKTGDILITTTIIPFIEHFGVVVVEGNTTCVYHCCPDRNVTLDTVVSFFSNRELISVRSTNATSSQIYARYKAVKHRRYNAINFNCIHFAEYLTSAK